MKNKEAIFQQLLSENKDRIYRICYAYLFDQSQVDDLFQDILINIWSNLHRFRGEAKWSTWIYRIAVNTALTYNKNARRENRLFVNRELPPKHVYEEHPLSAKIEQEKTFQKLGQCISQLDKQDRLIIGMVLDGLKYKEIAEILGLTINHTGVKINRIKAKLAKMMKTGTYGF